LFITYYSCAGYLRGGLGDEFPLRALAAHGIAAMCINRFAGSVGGGRNTEAYAVAEAGIGTIVDKLTSEGTIDPARVGVGGVSFGGEVAAWLAIHTHRLRALSVANVMLTPAYYWYNAVAGRDVAGVLRSSWGSEIPIMTAKDGGRYRRRSTRTGSRRHFSCRCPSRNIGPMSSCCPDCSAPASPPNSGHSPGNAHQVAASPPACCQ
jgi:hypothetical protein